MNFHRKAVEHDDDLMVSFRHGNFGAGIDATDHLIQLYIDDVGLTNTIGPRRDRQKMTMIYFLLDGIPDQFRSLLQSINLVAVVPSQALKVC